MTVTIKDVARVAGVSISAVSAALNNKPGVSKDTRLRINAVVENSIMSQIFWPKD